MGILRALGEVGGFFAFFIVVILVTYVWDWLTGPLRNGRKK